MTKLILIAGLAQLVEHLIRNEGVVGSSPITGTIKYKKTPVKAGIFYSYLKLSMGFSLAAFIAGITPDARPTTTATLMDNITGHIENGTL